MLSVLDKKIESVISEEQASKLALEDHEKQRELLIADIQSKSKKTREKDGSEDPMELDDVGGGSQGGLGALLGLKRNKYVLPLQSIALDLTCDLSRPPSSSAGGGSGFRKRGRP